MKRSKILSIGILLLILICSEFSLIKAEDPPSADIPSHITPGELLIRLTPEAAADVERLHADAPISILHTKHNVESLHQLFPYLARPSLNPNLKRIYLLRFAPDAPLEALKAAYEQNPLIEAVEYNYLRPTLADPITPNDPKYPEQWSLPLMKLPQAWASRKRQPKCRHCDH